MMTHNCNSLSSNNSDKKKAGCSFWEQPTFISYRLDSQRIKLPAIATAAAAVSTAAATAAAVSTAAAATTTTATAATTATLMRFVNIQCTAIKFRTVHLLNCSVSRTIFAESYETKTTATASVSVSNYFSIGNFAMLLESHTKTVIICVPAQATHKQFLGHFSLLLCWFKSSQS
jgi:hypothetical protein